MKKFHTISLALAAFLLVGCNLLPQTSQDTPPEITPPETTDTTNTETTPNPVKNPDWESFDADTYSFLYPPEATPLEREYGSVITFMGPKQIASGRTQTELFDGYSFSIEPVETTDELATFAQNERTNAEENCHSGEGAVSELAETTIANQPAFQFTVTDCYVDYTSTLVEHNGQSYRISQSYVGTPEDQAGYREITQQILQSIQFASN